jgi:hypothetical protein
VSDPLGRVALAKSQPVRLWDVFILGPAMIWLGTRPDKRLSSLEADLVALVGAGIIFYNGRNWLRIRKYYG